MALNSLIKRIPELKTTGFYVQHFPKYENTIQNPHSLDVILFSWFISGSGTHFIGDNKFNIIPGSIGITYCGQTHYIHTHESMEIINVYVNSEVLKLPLLPEPFMKYLHILLPMHSSFTRCKNEMLQIQCVSPGIITHLLLQIKEEFSHSRIYGMEMAYHLLKTFFMKIIREIIEHGYTLISQKSSRSNYKVMKVAAYLDTNFTKDISIDLLAQTFHLSRATLCRAFKEATGKTVFEFIIQKKIEDSCRMLRTTTQTITSIALAAGFNDISFFNKKFKEQTGKSPREFRYL